MKHDDQVLAMTLAMGLPWLQGSLPNWEALIAGSLDASIAASAWSLVLRSTLKTRNQGKRLPTDIVIELIDPNWRLEINEPMNLGRHGRWVSCFLDSLEPWLPWKLVSLVSRKPVRMENGCHRNKLSSPRGKWGT
jgi:hypothetical protein